MHLNIRNLVNQTFGDFHELVLVVDSWLLPPISAKTKAGLLVLSEKLVFAVVSVDAYRHQFLVLLVAKSTAFSSFGLLRINDPFSCIFFWS